MWKQIFLIILQKDDDSLEQIYWLPCLDGCPYHFCLKETNLLRLFWGLTWKSIELFLIFLVIPNLYGNLVGNTASGIAGGTGVIPGGTYRYPTKSLVFIFSGRTFLFWVFEDHSSMVIPSL
ncbi:uncharacterized protein LOC130774341 [Actinidia eriantha]|uniref:uncharacterized protein LOC130774341 n=1 Tax=Actinidia eriantha TaxID=165200 RepID=UPI00258C6775|nr:uncharacterized protein LOC130774341 [Actinidia eriantha]